MSSETDAQVDTPTDVGSRLRAARETKQISLREIATKTKISVDALEALEENDVERLPGGIFTRAFVRSYAAEVGLDPEQTMSEFMAQVPSEAVSEGTEYDDRSYEHDVFQSQQRMAGTVLKLVLVGVPVAGVLLYFGLRDAPTQTDAPEAPTEAVGVPPVEPRVPAAPLVAEVVPQGLTIVLRPREDCWVSLTLDGEPEPVIERTMRAGERLSYEADDAIDLIVGDPGAFAFTINQQDGRPLGGSGDAVTLHITRQNYRSWVEP